MKPTDLMIEDWVYRPVYEELEPVRVVNIHETGALSVYDGSGDIFFDYESALYEIRPIPLTTEILEKSGFEKVSLNSGKVCGWRDEEDSERGYYVMDITYRNKDRLYVEVHGSATVEKYCDYVHEFQHLLKLCGIEKEVVV